MKQIGCLKFWLPAFVVMALAFTSCNKDQDDWMDDLQPGSYIAVGTVQQADNGQFYFVEDDSTTIFPKNFQSISDTLVGKRVWFEFYKYLDAKAEPDYDMTAHLFNFGNYVLTKPYFVVETEAQNDSIGNDPAAVNIAWVTGKYLHVVASYMGTGNEPHYINLVKNEYNSDAADDGKIHLEFRHNDRDEVYVQRFVSVSSFDISDYFPTDGGSATLYVTYRPDAYSTRSFEGTLN